MILPIFFKKYNQGRVELVDSEHTLSIVNNVAVVPLVGDTLEIDWIIYEILERRWVKGSLVIIVDKVQ